jgi:hypothetical protein
MYASESLPLQDIAFFTMLGNIEPLLFLFSGNTKTDEGIG